MLRRFGSPKPAVKRFPPRPALASIALSAVLTLAAATALFGACGAGEAGDPAAPAAARPAQHAGEKHRGVSWEAGPEITADALAPLAELNVNWIVQTPFGWMRRHDSPEIRLRTDGGVFWGERDEGLEKTARWARELGIRTLLKPHLWLPPGEKWRAELEMTSEEDWQRFFSDYRTFILHYARLAERVGMEGLVIGTELHRAAVLKPDEWRRVIREVRAVYSGRLTYAANWHREFEDVTFWDALDWIGVQAYFPLSTDDARTSLADLKAGWAPHLEALRRVQRKFGKPLLFTEIGYKSTPGATRQPWVWLERSGWAAAEVDLGIQERAYTAFFETFWREPWFAGAYFWKWTPVREALGPEFVLLESRPPGSDPDFSPQFKPAERVLRAWYRSEAE